MGWQKIEKPNGELRFKATGKAVSNSKKSREWKKKYKLDHGTATGWTRSSQIADQEEITLDTLQRVANFARHRKNSKIAPKYKDEPWKDAGYVMWLAWGGDDGVDSAIEMIDKIEKDNKDESMNLIEKISDNDKTKRLKSLVTGAIKAMNGRVSDNSRAEKVVSILKKNMDVPKPIKAMVGKHMDKIGKGDERRLRQQLVKFKDELDDYLTSGGKDFEESKNLCESVLEGLDEAKAKRNLVQYNSNSNVYRPTIDTKGELEAGIYEIKADMQGVFYERRDITSDELLKFEDDRNKAILDEVSKFRKMKDDFEKIGMNHKRGMLLEGKPGTGKSCLIKLMAQEAVDEGDVVFICTSAGLIKEGLKKFKEVEPDRIGIVIIEEIDETLGYGMRTLSEVMDGQDVVNNILFVATTNHIERIHPKFLREGRFDSKINIGAPPKSGRVAFLKGKLGINEADDIVEEIADNTDGFTFAQLREYLISVYCYKRDPEKVIERIKRGSGLDESLTFTDEQIVESVFYYYYAQDRTRENSQGSNRIAAARVDNSYLQSLLKGIE